MFSRLICCLLSYRWAQGTQSALMSSVLGSTLGLVSLCAASSVNAGDMTILTNHLGYAPAAWKQAVIKGVAGNKLEQCELLDARTGASVYSAKPVAVGKVDQWRDWYFWRWEFSQVTAEGSYRIQCQQDDKTIESYPFAIQKNLLERNTLSDVLYYFKGQRSSGLLDKADRQMSFAENPDKAKVDVHGGWYDATGDYGKHLSHLSFSTYFNPQQIALVPLNLLLVYENLSARQDENFSQYRRRLLDEAMFGADYLVRVHVAGSSFYRSIGGLGATKAPEERRLMPPMKAFALKDKKEADWKGMSGQARAVMAEHRYEVSFRAGGGVAIASLAAAARQESSGDYNQAQYLQAAEDAFAFLQANNLTMTNDGSNNIVDDYTALMAATELLKTTGKDVYRTAARARAMALVKRLSGDKHYRHYWRADDKSRPFFHAAEAGFPVVSLMNYYPLASKKEQQVLLAAVRKNMEFELAITQEVNNPFGLARQYVQNVKGERRSAFFYPHDAETAPWWQGENARLGSLAAAARMVAKYVDDASFKAKLDTYAWNQLNWILGLNPFDASMLEGTGRNNVQYGFFNTFQYTNAPGGIVNGITSGLDNERDIDLNRGYAETGKDNDWRWAEQWLPHTAWYIYAIALE
jgi:hypothetical protein